MKETFYLTRQLEIETNIEIKKEDTLYFAYINAEGYSERKIHCFINSYNQIDIEECETEEEWDCIRDLFIKYVEANGIKYARKCDKCGKGMNEGYVVNGGQEYYCTDECLYKVYTKEEWENMSNDELFVQCGIDDDGNYWTQWDDETDYFYTLFDDELIEL